MMLLLVDLPIQAFAAQMIYIWGIRYHPELKIIKLFRLDPTQQEANAWGTCLLHHAPLIRLSLKIYKRYMNF